MTINEIKELTDDELNALVALRLAQYRGTHVDSTRIDYCHDLNAMHGVEKMFCNHYYSYLLVPDYTSSLDMLFAFNTDLVFTAARQRAEAFVYVFDKYEDKLVKRKEE